MISKFSVKRPYTVFVVVIAVIVVGIVAMTKMTMDLLPNMTLPYVMVITTDMGASPETVEKEVTAPIEASLATTSNLKNIQSMSYNSYSAVILEYEQTSNMDATIIEIQQSIEQVKSTFDDSIGTPIVMQLNPDMIPIMVAGVGVEGMDNTETTDFVSSEILPDLEGIEGVASVTTIGGVEETVEVTLNQAKIDKLNEKIMDDIDAQFDEATASVTDAKQKIESGKNAIKSGSKTAAETIGENQAKLSQAQVELYQTESDLKAQKSELETTYATLTTTMESLNTTYQSAVQLNEGITNLQGIIDMYDQGMIDDEALAAMLAELPPELVGDTPITDIEGLRTLVGTLQGQMDQLNGGIATAGSALSSYGITLNTYEDIPAAIEQLTAAQLQVSQGIATIDIGLQKIAEGKETTSTAMSALNSAGISSSLEIADASAQLTAGESQLSAAETSIKDAKKEAKDKADLENVLSIDMLNNLLLAQNFEMPAGYVSSDNGQYLVKVGDDIPDVESLDDLVLINLNMDHVKEIKLSDIADIEQVDNSKEVYAKINGNNAIILSFEKQTGYSTGDVTDNILAKFESLEETEEQPVSFSVLMDQGVYIDIIFKSIVQNILLGAGLAIFILIIFLRDVRPTIIIACAIPLSIIFAIVLMYFSGITLNIISMSGLTLGIGMLVDNSIVVIENIFRLRKKGESVKKAAVYGASQVAGAITASTLTTMCVFLPIVFTEGLTRQLFVDMGLTIAYTLTASLIVALTLVPAMAQGLLKKAKAKESNTENKFYEIYGKFVAGALKFKPIVFLAIITLLVVSMVLSVSRGTQFMPEMSSTQVTVTLSAPEDEERTFEEMAGYADTLVERIKDLPDLQTTGAMIGSGSTLGALGGTSNDVTLYLIFDDNAKIDNDEINDKIMAAAEDLDCETTVSAEMMDMSALSGSGISVMIKGRDMQKIQSLAEDVAKIMEETEGTVDVDNGISDLTQELVISVDKSKAAKYGLTVAQVFAEISKSIASTKSSTTISTDLKDYDVYVMTEKQSEVTDDDLKKIEFTYTDMKDQKEKKVKLTEIAKFSEVEESSSILRDAQNRYISVTANVDENHNIGLVGAEIQRKLNLLDVPEGYSLKMKGENESINDAMRQVLLMMLLAVILIYLIMVAQFQSLLSPFIIMFTIPLAFTGGFFSLYFTGNPISVISMIGFVMLAGIIVNNGIVLVDYVNQLRREGMAKKDAIVEASKTRLRPVFMTALTTIISMSTMALGFGNGTEMSQPMAIVVVGGMIYGTLLTLIFVPCLYDAFNRDKDMREEDLDEVPVEMTTENGELL